MAHATDAGGGDLTGRVVGPDGSGVGGAQVWIAAHPRRATTTAPDGTFVLGDLPCGTHEVRARAGDRIAGPQAIRVTARGAALELALREAAHLVVTVVDARAAPVAHAAVRVVGGDDDATTRTDAHGAALLTVHPGWVTIEVTHAGYAPRRLSVTTAWPGTTSRQPVILHEGFAVAGRVVDRDGAPIASARIYARQVTGALIRDPDEPASAITDAAGRFAIPAAVGMHTFVAIGDDHAPAATPLLDVDRPLSELELVMKPGAIYAGRVLAADGQPVSRAQVHVAPLGGLGGIDAPGISTRTDREGAFAIRGLARSAATVHAVSDTTASDEVLVRIVDAVTQRDHTLTLVPSDHAPGVIAGTLVDDTGMPVPHAVVHTARHRRGSAAPLHASALDRSVATSTLTDARGAFTLVDMPAGEYGVWVGPFDAASPFTLASTGDNAVQLVAPRPGRISGRVVFADTGELVDAFTVGIQPSSARAPDAPGEQGVLDVPDLPPGRYTVHVRSSHGLVASASDVLVEAATRTDLGTIAIDRARMLRGTVVDEAGRGIADATVVIGAPRVLAVLGRLDDPRLHGRATRTDATGAFTLVGDFRATGPGGPLVVVADHPAHGRSIPTALPPDARDAPPLTLVVVACGSITGSVTDASARPFVGALVEAGSPPYLVAQVDEDGRFALPRVPPGTVALRVDGPRHHADHHQIVAVTAGQPTEVTLDVPDATPGGDAR